TASVADDGTVVYTDGSDNLVSGFSGAPFDVYLYHPVSQANELISSVPGSPMEGVGGCGLGAVISANGSTVGYVGPDNGVDGQGGPQVDNGFRLDRTRGVTTLVSGSGGSATTGGNANSGAAGLGVAVSRDGRYIAFTSAATDLVSGQTGAPGNVFL